MKEKNMKKISLNNSGSTLIMSVLAILFISLLASVIMAASVSNVVMKKIDSNSKGTFYTAESVLDEIKVGVGKDSIGAMGNAYEHVLSNLIITEYNIDYMMENEKANDLLKQKFMEQMVRKVTGAADITPYYKDDLPMKTIYSTDTTVIENAISYLGDFVAKEEKRFAVIKSIESIDIIRDNAGIENTIIFENVVINYKAQKGSETYFADVTVDINIAYPDMVVDFSATNRLDDFRHFALIADKAVNVNNYKAEVYAGIYAGENINVSGGTGEAGLLVGANGLKPSNVVTKGNINVTAGANKAGINIGNSYLWCRNLVTANGPSGNGGAYVTVDSASKTYIADDLDIKCDNSDVKIDGEYYGYGYSGGLIINGTLSESSAIIISGEGSKLTLGTAADKLKKLVIAGHSYIDYDYSDEYYMLGESVSMKANQEIYLVPEDYIGKTSEKSVSNPMTVDAYEALKTEVGEENIVDLSGFFAEDLLASTKYIVRKDSYKNLMYIYLSFKDNASAGTYVERVLAGGGGSKLLNKMQEYANELLTASGGIVVNAPGGDKNSYVAGSLMSLSSGSLGNVGVGTQMSEPEFMNVAKDCANRYEILSILLYPVPYKLNEADYTVSDIAGTMQLLKQYTWGTSEDRNSTTSNVIRWSEVSSTTTYNKRGLLLTGVDVPADPDKRYTKIVSDANVTIDGTSGGANYGVIVTTGDVYIKSNFTGLVIAQGNIHIANGVTLTTDINMVEKLITWEYDFAGDIEDSEHPTDFREYFHAYKSDAADADSIKIENLQYDDIISLDNWRKYED